MSRARAGLSIGVIVALAVAIWAAIAAGGDDPPPTTTSAPPVTTTTTVAPTTSSTTPSTTAAPPTSTPDTTTDAEARLEEVRLILEDLYFRWFEAIYNNDEEAVLEAIATSNNLEDFRRAVETLDLPSAPQRDEVVITKLDILRDDSLCLVTYSVLDVTKWRGEGSLSDGVNVLLPVEGEWRFGTAWENKGDLWEPDCLIEPDLP